MSQDINKINDDFFDFLDEKSKKLMSSQQLKAIKTSYYKKSKQKQLSNKPKSKLSKAKYNFDLDNDIFKIL